jgi:2-phospho-L-lactate guanylyltransferase
MRSLSNGKRRLGGVLSDERRQQLNESFLDHTLRVATAVFSPNDCMVISPAPEVLARATGFGVQTLLEQAPPSLNNALALGAAWADADGIDAVIALSCDLPWLSAMDLQALAQALRPATVVLAPDRQGKGTNALGMAPPQAMSYAYGPDSCARHAAAAQLAGLAFQMLRRPGLETDIDTPDDLARYGLPSVAEPL